MGYVDSPRSIPELPAGAHPLSQLCGAEAARGAKAWVQEGDMTRQDKRMTSEELVHDVGSVGLWLFAAILLVLAAAAVLESIATR